MMKLKTLLNRKYLIPEKDGRIPNVVVEKAKGSFKKSISIYIIAIITVWSITQLYLTSYIGLEPLTAEWSKIFVLDTANPDYYWTYFTSMLSHGSLFHLFINMFVFFSFARLIEYELSKIEYVAFLVITGVLSGAGQVAISTMFMEENMKMVGFSGALSGVIGYIAVRFDVPVHLFFIIKMNIDKAVAIFTVFSVGVILVIGPGAFQIAHTAHLTGLLCGLVYGAYKERTITDKFKSRLIE